MLPLDTAEIPQYTTLSLGKNPSISYFPLFERLHNKVVFSGAGWQKPSCSYGKMDTQLVAVISYCPCVRVLRLSFSDNTALEKEL